MDWSATLGAVAVALLGWLASKAWGWGWNRADRRKVYGWLRDNTRDEPGESHVSTATLVKGTGLPEDRVRRACETDSRIYQYKKGDEEWSIWRHEPPSIYEKRGVLSVQRRPR
jgi:hypothetical protein